MHREKQQRSCEENAARYDRVGYIAEEKRNANGVFINHLAT
jgi:hypothetical protein